MTKEGKISVRLAVRNDIPLLQEIYSYARSFMKENGNPNQWAENYPSTELITNDIDKKDCYVCLYGNEIVGTFVLHFGIDETYNYIYDGEWLNDLPYATIHRIASNGKAKGIFHHAIGFAKQKCLQIRIDTHRDNIVMQNAILKEGFKYCGVIRCWNGSERLAYQYSAI